MNAVAFTPLAMIRVSIVEDDPGIRENLLHFLGKAPDIKLASEHGSAEDALRHLPAIKPDVVLMDINLPGMSGIDCVRKLKAMLPGVQVLMVTVFEDGDSIFKALLAGANGYLLKNAIARDIVPAVHDVMNGSAPLTGMIARKVVQFFTRQHAAAGAKLDISPREREVLDLLSKGLTYKAIADRLEITVDTVRRHCHHIYQKLHVSSRTEAVVKYLEG
jgi:DNA-binding NarL/FixJ family response regulator